MSNADTPNDVPLLQREFAETLILAARRLRRSIDQLGSVHNVSAAHVDVLMALENFDEGTGQAALAQHLGIGGAALTRLVDRLSAWGLISRIESPDDGRANLVQLTERGAGLTSLLDRRLISHRASVMDRIEPAHLQIALLVLDEVVNRVPSRGHIRLISSCCEHDS